MEESNEIFTEEILVGEIVGDSLAQELREEPEITKIQPISTYQKRKRRRIDEIRSLRRAVDELEAMRDSLQHKTGKRSRESSVPDPDSVWMTVALRQHRRLHASRSENERLVAEVSERGAIVKRLASLVMDAQSNCPREDVANQFSPENVSAILHLTKVSSSMLAIVDTVFEGTEVPKEFQKLTLCQHNVSNIAMDSMVATMAATRFVPRPRSAICEQLWKLEPSYPPGPIRVKILHHERSEQSQRIYYQIHFTTAQGVFRFHAVGVSLRQSEDSRDVIVSSSVTWPDTETPSPWNAISFLMRGWVVVQPLADGEVHQVRSKTQSFRHGHANAPQDLTLQEATTLQIILVQVHQRILNNQFDAIDDLLIQPSSIQCV